MKINLKKAATVQSEVLNLSKELHRKIEEKSMIEITSVESLNYETNPIRERRDEITKLVREYKEAIGTYVYIRSQVSSKNSKDINSLLVELNGKEKLLSFYVDMVTRIPIRKTFEHIKATIESAEKSTTFNRPAVVSTSVIDDSDVVEFENKIKSLKKEIRDIKDRLLELNSKTTIILEGAYLEFLEREMLV